VRGAVGYPFIRARLSGLPAFLRRVGF